MPFTSGILLVPRYYVVIVMVEGRDQRPHDQQLAEHDQICPQSHFQTIKDESILCFLAM